MLPLCVCSVCVACGNFLATYTRLIATTNTCTYTYLCLCCNSLCCGEGIALARQDQHTHSECRRQTSQTQRKATVCLWTAGLRHLRLRLLLSQFGCEFVKRERVKHPGSVAASHSHDASHSLSPSPASSSFHFHLRHFAIETTPRGTIRRWLH